MEKKLKIFIQNILEKKYFRFTHKNKEIYLKIDTDGNEIDILESMSHIFKFLEHCFPTNQKT